MEDMEDMEDVAEADVFLSFVSPINLVEEEDDDATGSLKHETEVEESVVDVDAEEEDVLCSCASLLYSVDDEVGVGIVSVSLLIDMDNAIAKSIS